jgi:hypothetical protein
MAYIVSVGMTPTPPLLGGAAAQRRWRCARDSARGMCCASVCCGAACVARVVRRAQRSGARGAASACAQRRGAEARSWCAAAAAQQRMRGAVGSARRNDARRKRTCAATPPPRPAATRRCRPPARCSTWGQPARARGVVRARLSAGAAAALSIVGVGVTRVRECTRARAGARALLRAAAPPRLSRVVARASTSRRPATRRRRCAGAIGAAAKCAPALRCVPADACDSARAPQGESDCMARTRARAQLLYTRAGGERTVGGARFFCTTERRDGHNRCSMARAAPAPPRAAPAPRACIAKLRRARKHTQHARV